MIRLIDRYLLRELVIPLAYCLSGFMIFWLALNLFSDIADFQREQLGFWDVAKYYLALVPEWMSIAFPIALLLALLYALTTHSRHQELLAIRGAGISTWRLAGPYFAVGLLTSVCLFLLNEVWAPGVQESAEALLERKAKQPNSPNEPGWEHNLGFVSPNGRVWRIESFHRGRHQIQGVSISWILEDGTRRSLLADSGSFDQGQWTLSNVVENLLPSTPGALAERRTTNEWRLPELNEHPDRIAREARLAKILAHPKRGSNRSTLPLREILRFEEEHALDASKRAFLRTQFHSRLSDPLTCLVVVFVALPFGVVPVGGRKNVFVGVAASLAICFVYFVVSRLGLALGTSGRIPAWLAAWGPNLLFTAIGVWLTKRSP